MSVLYERFLAVGSVRSLMSGRDILPQKEENQSSSLKDVFDQKPSDSSFKRLKRIERIVQDSPAGAEILEAAKKTGARFRLDDTLENCGGIYLPTERTVLLNAKESDAFLSSTMVHESRHAWQDAQALVFTPDLDAKSFIMMGYAIEADAVSMEARFAHDIKQKHPEVWRALMDDKYACVALAYEKGIKETNMVAGGLDGAFQAWYQVSSVPLYAADYVDFIENSSKGIYGEQPEFLSIQASPEKVAQTICRFGKNTYLKDPSVLETPEKLFLPAEQKERLDQTLMAWSKLTHRSVNVGSESIYAKNPDGSYTPGKVLVGEKPQSAFNPLWKYGKNNGRS